MPSTRLGPEFTLLLIPSLLLACGDDGGRETAGAMTAGSVTLTSVSSVSGDTTEGDSTPTTSGSTQVTAATADGTSGTDGTSPTDPTDVTTTTDPASTLTDATTTSTGTTGLPGALGCSDDLHNVVDEQGNPVEACPSDQACYAGACVPACEAVADLGGTVGCDFWAPTPPFLSNGQGSALDGPCFAVFLANAWNGPANITVSRGGQAIDVAQYARIPKANGNTSIFNWTGRCQGQPCTFWMTDNPDGNVSCGGYEPNGDNSTTFRIYKVADGCGVQGGWNDAFNAVAFTGHVLCSPNDC